MTLIMIMIMKTNTYTTDCIYTEQSFNLEYLLGETGRLCCKPTCSCNQRSLPPGEGLPYERGGMLVVSFRVAREEMYKNYILYSIHAI